MELRIKRIYETPAEDDGFRVLVDRLWPRGQTKEKAALDLWAKDLAPSPELRQWFHHEPEKWPEFQARYAEELDRAEAKVAEFRAAIQDRARVTLLYGAKSDERNQAVALKAYLERKKG